LGKHKANTRDRSQTFARVGKRNIKPSKHERSALPTVPKSHYALVTAEIFIPLSIKVTETKSQIHHLECYVET
jgi:hypothetical protein